MIRDRREKQEKRKRIIRLCFLLLIISSIFFLFVSIHKKPQPVQTTEALVAATVPTIEPTSSETGEFKNSSGLEQAVQSALSGSHGTYGIAIKNVKTSESYYLQPTQQFNSASLYKLWVMATVFQQVQEKKIKLSDVLKKDIVQLNKDFHVDPDPNEQTSGTLTLSVQDALYNMITISSNNAALLLTEKVQVPTIVSFLQKNGFTDSIIGIQDRAPTTTAYEIALFLEKLYRGDLANKENTNAMITLLKQQRLNDKLPKYLPDGITVAHKTGELDDYTHDAGIVYTPSGDYIIVVLSQSDNTDLAKERIALISQAVYNYFTQKPSE